MCAATKLSFVSAVCEPVTSILVIVAAIVMFASPAAITNRAVPYELFRRGPPPDKVGLVGGTSCEFVRLTMKSVVDMFALFSRLSTYWALVNVEGYLATKSGRVTKSLK